MRCVVAVLFAGILLCAAVQAGASTRSIQVQADDIPLDAHSALSQLSVYELLLLPSPLRDHVMSTLQMELPGPNGALEPNLGLLMRRVTTLQLPMLGTSKAWSVSQAPVEDGVRLTFNPPGSPVPVFVGDGGTLDASSASAGSPSSAPASDDVGTQSARSPSQAESASAIERAWDNVPPAGKVAIGAGILGLLLFGPLAMYSRIRRDDALVNDTRRKVYEVIEQNPGLCIKDVSDRTGVSYSTASYHLDRLVKTGFLVASGQGNRVLYYKNGGTFSREERDLVPILKNGECMRVFNHVLENPWCYRAEVAQALGVSHTTVNWHLKRLIDAQLVQEHREGRNCHLFVDKPQLDRVMAVLDKIEAMAVTEEPQPVPVQMVPA